MTNGDLGWITNYIWGIADDVLRDVYVRGKYRDVILPMTVLRRLDAVLEPTKQAVLDMKDALDEMGIADQRVALRQAAEQPFYNTSKFTLHDLRARASRQQLRADFEDYLDGFSPSVQDILENFEFRNQIPRLSKADALGTLIEKLTSPDINLSPEPVRDTDGTVRHPGLDNHGMGTVFEELIRRFNEENNEEAGEHFTPRDAVELMAKLVFLPVADEIDDGTYLLYDGACGTGGMLTVGEDVLQQLAEERGKQVSTHLFGQEINAETYAICKADLLLKGEGEAADNIVGGPEHSTLSNDAFPTREFDFMLSNPPYGKSWKTDLERMGGKKEMRDHRFVIEHADDPEYSLVTRSSDGQMLFLANGSPEVGIPAGNRLKSYRTARSAFPAVGLDRAGPCRKRGKTGHEWRDLPRPRRLVTEGPGSPPRAGPGKQGRAGRIGRPTCRSAAPTRLSGESFPTGRQPGVRQPCLLLHTRPRSLGPGRGRTRRTSASSSARPTSCHKMGCRQTWGLSIGPVSLASAVAQVHRLASGTGQWTRPAVGLPSRCESSPPSTGTPATAGQRVLC